MVNSTCTTVFPKQFLLQYYLQYIAAVFFFAFLRQPRAESRSSRPLSTSIGTMHICRNTVCGGWGCLNPMFFYSILLA
jgi:hypothetical protein